MKNKLLTLTGLALTTGVLATPTIYPKDSTYLSKIVNKTNSNLVADDSDQRVIWVMPPNTAFSKVGNLHTITANVGFCREMADLQGYSRSLSAKLEALKNQEIENKDKREALAQKISDARKELSEYIVSNKLFDITEIDDRLTTVEQQIDDLTSKLDTCQQNCSEVSSQLLDLRKEKVSLTRQRREVGRDRLTSIRMMDRKKAALEGYEKDLQDLINSYDKMGADIESLRNRFIAMYSQFGKMEGARASIEFKSEWESNIQSLRNENRDYDFKEIHTQNAVIYSNLIAGNLPADSAILAYEIPGSTDNDKITLPSYPSDISGNLRLSLIGTCPALHPELFDINVPNGTDQMKYGLVVAYEFPSTFDVGVKVSYNMHRMYEKIVKSKTKGGLFSSSKKTTVSEKTLFEDSLKIAWSDEAKLLTSDQKDEIEVDLRNNVYARLANIGLPAVPNAINLVAEATGPTGAAVLASSLANNKACKANKWCTAAAMGVNVLNAVFGSSSSTTSYKNVQDVWLTDDWSRKEVVYKPWVTSYR